jgi:hypothetical protein
VVHPTFDARLCTGILQRCSDAVIFADREGVIRLWNEGVTEGRRSDRELLQRFAALEVSFGKHMRRASTRHEERPEGPASSADGRRYAAPAHLGKERRRQLRWCFRKPRPGYYNHALKWQPAAHGTE